MKVAFSQVYIDQHARLPMSVDFQRLITASVSAAVHPSDHFIESYGPEFKIVFNVSAKRKKAIEIRGPSISRKYKVVEYTMFLPHPAIIASEDPYRQTVQLLLHHSRNILANLQFDTSKLDADMAAITQNLLEAPNMIKEGLQWL